MLGKKAGRVRRKLRALQRTKLPARRTRGAAPEPHVARAVDRDLAESAVAITTACNAVAAGLELCARRTSDPIIAVAARNAADCLRALFERTITIAATHGIDARPRARTCERLRWEWLASTAMVIDGSSDSRLLSECARILSDVVSTTRADIVGDQISARLRVASAEAYSLASAVQNERRQKLALALA